ncbi:uncharacterized protein M6B38_109810 [Iris pallida]|uniref:Uncharacterized protein n=1 Tax=Iris pallida TaxID=29817 RepID=A0AAX6E8U4_IRIPA|nr:uncharacterized protein M6B38_109810 [Iris pallida]
MSLAGNSLPLTTIRHEENTRSTPTRPLPVSILSLTDNDSGSNPIRVANHADMNECDTPESNNTDAGKVLTRIVPATTSSGATSSSMVIIIA